MIKSVKTLYGGLFLIALISFTSIYFSEVGIFKSAGVSSLIIAIILGVIYGNTVHHRTPSEWFAGISFAQKRLLRLGIILYGFRITFQQIAQVGVAAMLLDVFVVSSILLLGYFLGVKLFKLDKKLSVMIACGSSICGAAAVLRAYFRRAKRKQQELLEQRMTQMKFRFFTNVSHELRTPLTLIITPLEQLLGSVCDEGLQGRLRPIYRHACELLELINHLLDFRKLETDSEKLYLLNGDLPEFVRTTCESFKPLSENRGVAFRCDVAADHFFMYFDPDKIHRVLYNLLGNAFKFTPSGGRVGVSAGLSVILGNMSPNHTSHHMVSII